MRNARSHVRVVLVEVTTPPRLHSALAFPFLKGAAGAAGLSCRWLRFSYPPDVALRSGGAGGAFPELDDVLVTELLEEEGASHVLFSAAPSPALLSRLSRALPTASVRTQETDPPPTPQAFLAWLGIGEVIAADPDYGWEPGNEAAKSPEQPPVFVTVAPECVHRTQLAHAAFFSGASVADLPERWGCSFCTNPCLDDVTGVEICLPLEEELRRQLGAIFRTHPPVEGSLCVRINGSRAALSPITVARVIEELSPPPCRLLFDYRADHFVRRREAIAEAARALGGQGHRFEVVLMGIESFSAEQLDRYNKGYRPEVNLQALRQLEELEDELGEAFEYRVHGGLSTLLFDPWCSFADVALNIEVARLLRLDDTLGKLLSSRLRLYADLPLAAMARRDDLTIERYEDPWLDTARRNFYGQEIPWRFREPRMEAVNRLLTRLEPEDEAQRDELGVAVAELRRDTRALDVAAEIVQAAVSSAAPLSPNSLLRAVEERRAREGEEAIDDKRPLAFEEPFAFLSDFAAFGAGLKPVIKIESHGESWPEGLVRAVERRCGDVVVLRGDSSGAGGAWFVSRDAEKAREAWELTRKLEQLDVLEDPEAHEDAVARVGELLGYPSCCARSFARMEQSYHGRYEWMRLRRRVEFAGEVSEGMGPQELSFVPCRLDCPEAGRFSDEARARLTSERRRFPLSSYDAETALRRKSERLPTLRFLDDETRFAVIEPREPIAGRVRRVGGVPIYRFRYSFLGGPLLPEHREVLADGDELELAPGTVSVLREGVERYVFALSAYLWCHERAFHEEFWQEILVAPTLGRPAASEPVHQEPPEREVAEEPPPPPERFDPDEKTREAIRATVQELFGRLKAKEHPAVEFFELISVDARRGEHGWGRVRVRTSHRGELFTVCFVSRDDPAPRFRETERLAVYHEADTPASSAAHRRLMELLVRSLERVFPGESE